MNLLWKNRHVLHGAEKRGILGNNRERDGANKKGFAMDKRLIRIRGLIRESRTVSHDGQSINCVLLRPKNQSQKLPGLLWIHGGGYVTGGSYMVYFSRAIDIALEIGAVVLAPDYRLAKRNPYPAALEDCYAALAELFHHAEELGIDPARISVGGESAGGGLTAALCMFARDQGVYPIKSQLPLYPMLDCEDTASSRDNHGHGWNTARNHAAWKVYLSSLNRELPIPAYASPARQTDFRNLPPAYTFVGDGEPFYSETLQYVEKLREAGVSADYDVYSSATHAFDLLLPWLKISKAARQRMLAAARRLL